MQLQGHGQHSSTAEAAAGIPMPLPEAELGVVAPSEGFEGAEGPEGAEEAVVSSSCLMVDVEVDLLLKPLVSGARCVSFSSNHQSATAGVPATHAHSSLISTT